MEKETIHIDDIDLEDDVRPEGFLNIRREIFCQEIVKGALPGDAFTVAFPVYDNEERNRKSEGNKGRALLQLPIIKWYIRQLRNLALERFCVDVRSLTRELEMARQKAMNERAGANAAISASLAKAKIHGLLIDRIVKETTVRDITDKQLDEEIEKLQNETNGK